MFNECLEISFFKKILILASLISLSKIILFERQYQAFDTVFQHQMKHLEIRQKYFAARLVFNSLLDVSCNISNMRCSVSSPVLKLINNSLRKYKGN